MSSSTISGLSILPPTFPEVYPTLEMLNDKLLTRDTETIWQIANHLDEDYLLQEQLIEVINGSKRNVEISIAAANALRILVAGGVNLSNLDLMISFPSLKASKGESININLPILSKIFTSCIEKSFPYYDLNQNNIEQWNGEQKEKHKLLKKIEGTLDAIQLILWVNANAELGSKRALLMLEEAQKSQLIEFNKTHSDEKNNTCEERKLEEKSTASPNYQIAAKNGDVNAQFKLAQAYEHGTLEIKKDQSEALKWYKLSAEGGNEKAKSRLEHAFLRHELGMEKVFLGYSRPLKDTLNWLKSLANKGDHWAYYWLGYANQSPLTFGLKKNLVEALRCYQISADLGNTDAKVLLAGAYDRGEYGVIQDQEKAKRLLFSAAEQGSERAIKILEEVIRQLLRIKNSSTSTYGIEIEEATIWVKKHAEEGLPWTQFVLAEAYEKGRLGPNSAMALHWYQVYACGDKGLRESVITILDKAYREDKLGVHSENSLVALNWLHDLITRKKHKKWARNRLEEAYRKGWFKTQGENKAIVMDWLKIQIDLGSEWAKWKYRLMSMSEESVKGRSTDLYL